MSYGLLDLSNSVEAQARGGLRAAGDMEHRRNLQNKQLEDAEKAQQHSLMTTAGTVGLDAGLTSYYDGVEAAKIAADAEKANAALTAEKMASVDAAVKAKTASDMKLAADAVHTKVAADGVVAADTANKAIAATELATTAGTTGAVTGGTAVAGGTTAAAGAGTAAASAGPLAALGPLGWTALAGLALYSFL